MQHHAGAIILAAKHYLKDATEASKPSLEYRIQMIGSDRKAYDVKIEKDYGSQLIVKVNDFWSSTDTIYLDGRNSSSQRWRINHDDSSTAEDILSVQKDEINNGVFRSEDRQSYSFSGRHYPGSKQLNMKLTNKKNQEEEVEYTIQSRR